MVYNKKYIADNKIENFIFECENIFTLSELYSHSVRLSRRPFYSITAPAAFGPA